MKTGVLSGKKISRAILLLFLLLLIAGAIFVGVQAFFLRSAMTRMGAEGVTWMAVLQRPEEAGKVLMDPDLQAALRWTVWQEKMLPGATAKDVAAFFRALPDHTLMVGYPTGPVLAFFSEEKACMDREKTWVQTTYDEGMCFVHAGPLDDRVRPGSAGTLAKAFGGMLPDQPTGVAVVFGQGFPYGDMMTHLAGEKVTPDVLLLRSLVSKVRFVALSMTYDAAGTLLATTHVVLPKEFSFPAELSAQSLRGEDLRGAALPGDVFGLMLTPTLPTAWQTWLRNTYEESVARLVQFRFLALLEPLSPVAIDTKHLPNAQVFVSLYEGKTRGRFMGTDEEERRGITRAVTHALTFLYGLQETATTLPDATRGLLVTASDDAITTTVDTLSGSTMTTFLAKGEPRLEMVVEGDSTTLQPPKAGTGTTLSPMHTEARALPWRFPLQGAYSLLGTMTLPSKRALSLGLLPMGDRLGLDLALSSPDQP